MTLPSTNIPILYVAPLFGGCVTWHHEERARVRTTTAFSRHALAARARMALAPIFEPRCRVFPGEECSL